MSNSRLLLVLSKWERLRTFLIEEGLKGNETAMKLLEELPENTREVRA